MNKNLTVLVLLVAWSLLTTASLSSAVYAGDIPENLFLDEGSSSSDLILPVCGVGSDGDDDGPPPPGDPGDMGDGYGIAGGSRSFGGFYGGDVGDKKEILGELWLILMSLVQLAP